MLRFVFLIPLGCFEISTKNTPTAETSPFDSALDTATSDTSEPTDTATTPDDEDIEIAITDLQLTLEEHNDVWQPTLHWLDASNVECQYEIWRWEIQLGWQQLTTLDYGATSWQDNYPADPLWLSQTVYRVIAKWNSVSYPLEVWGSNQLTGNQLNYVYTANAPWNAAFQVPNYMQDWQAGDQVSVEEVGLVGGNVVPYWSQKMTIAESQKNLKEQEHMNLARQIASANDTPIRFFIETRPDVYGEPTAEAASGFQDDWLLQVPREETCTTLLDLHNRGYSIVFAQHNSLDFWTRIWGEHIDTSTDNWLFTPEGCASGNTAPIFYGKQINATTFSLNYVLTDLRNPNFIAWHTDLANETVQLLQPEGIFFPIKSAWEAYAEADLRDFSKLTLSNGQTVPMWQCDSYRPALLSDTLDYEIHSPLSACTPYAADEFESGLRSWVQAFRQKSPQTLIATNENPAKGGDNGKLSWIGSQTNLRDAIIGELYLGAPLADFYTQTN